MKTKRLNSITTRMLALLGAIALFIGLPAAADEDETTTTVSVLGEDSCFDSRPYKGVNALPLETSQIYPSSTGDTVVNDMDCMPGKGPKVLIGYWDVGTRPDGEPNKPVTNPCVGQPLMKIAYPVNFGSKKCYCWKHWVAGQDDPHENSAKDFVCGAESFKLTQWTNLTCSDDAENIDHKTAWTTKCCQDAPGNLYSQILNLSGCTEKPGETK